MSRQPVLQALRLLKKDGLVLDAPGRGVLVAPLDAGLASPHVYQVRGALDALAARLAAQQRAAARPGADRARPRARRAGRDVKAMIEADIAFHGAIYAASRQPADRRRAPSLHWQPHPPRHGRRAAGVDVSAKRSGTNTRPSPRPSPPATPTRAERLIDSHGERASEQPGRATSTPRALQRLPTTQGDNR